MRAPYFQDSHTTVYQGDAREVLKGLPERSVQCVVTSPPYWGLRDYKLPASVWRPPGPPGPTPGPHDWDEMPDKRNRWAGDEGLSEKQASNAGATITTSQGAFCRLCGAWRGTLGLEPTPELYVEHLVAVFREVRRVLRDDGTVWLNLGDSYAGNPSNGRGGESPEGGIPHRSAREKRGAGLKPKDLVGIPWAVAFALRADGWWLRSDIVWSKPNPMPESVQDRPTRSHEYVFLLSKKSAYYYDANAIREPLVVPPEEWERRQGSNGGGRLDYAEKYASLGHKPSGGMRPDAPAWGNPAGRNKRSVWEIATQPYPDAHFATFPEALVRPCILAGTSEKGACAECGAPWERVTEREYRSPIITTGTEEGRYDKGRNRNVTRMGDGVDVTTTGWRPTCKHEAETQPCTVLDPFAGSGTTALVARKAGRKAILIELSEEYCRLIVDRIGQGVLL